VLHTSGYNYHRYVELALLPDAADKPNTVLLSARAQRPRTMLMRNGSGRWPLQPLLLAACLGAACGSDPGDPVSATRGFLRAVARGNCDAVWERLSENTQRRADAVGRARVAGGFYSVDTWAPRQLLCRRPEYANGSFQAWFAKLVWQSDARARVRTRDLEFVGELLPGFGGIWPRWVMREYELERRGGAWQLDLPTGDAEPLPWERHSRRQTMVSIDGVEITSESTGRGRWVSVHAAPGASVAALQALIERPERWGEVLPWPLRIEAMPDPHAPPERLVEGGELGPAIPLTTVGWLKRLLGLDGSRREPVPYDPPLDRILNLHLTAPSGETLSTAFTLRIFARIGYRSQCCLGVGAMPVLVSDAVRAEGLPFELHDAWVAVYPGGDGSARLQLAFGYDPHAFPAALEAIARPEVLAAWLGRIDAAASAAMAAR
jgi:hypothetical protein